jgi:hypothetical protein
VYDDDYTMNLETPDARGALAGDGGRVHLEFNSEETIDRFGSWWWSRFHEAVDNSGNTRGGYSPAADLMIGGHQAIVTGLMGIDWAHQPGAESHPVWALAIQVNLGSWAFFVRNWGNEGQCSRQQYHLNGLPGEAWPNWGGTYKFKLPWEYLYGRRGQVIPANGVAIAPPEIRVGDNNGSEVFPGAEVDFSKVEDPTSPDLGVYVTFHLAPPEDGSFYEGMINLGWTFPPGTLPPPPPPHDPFCHKAPPPPGCEGDSPGALVEGRLGSLMSPSQYRALAAALNPPLPPDRPLSPHAIHIGSLPQAPPLPHSRPTSSAVPDPEHALRDKLQQALLCWFFGGTIPSLPAACPPPATRAGQTSTSANRRILSS